jgi:hypothetical protein
MLDFQEQVAEPCPLLTKENYHEEISHLTAFGVCMKKVMTVLPRTPVF